jgi:hypothetical protein
MKKTLVTFACALAAHGAFAQATAQAPASAASAASPAARHEARIEQRIAYLHTQLKITPQEEPQWKAFADAMRDDGDTMSRLYQQRAANMATASALDNMHNYAQLMQTHADGVKKIATAFEPLYNSFSPEQKQLANVTFRDQGPHHRHGTQSKKPAQ